MRCEIVAASLVGHFSRKKTLAEEGSGASPSSPSLAARLPSSMSFFQRVVHHLVNEVLVSGLANRCDVEVSPPTAASLFLLFLLFLLLPRAVDSSPFFQRSCSFFFPSFSVAEAPDKRR